jgi:chaperonin GroEL (HSP60 family)
MSKNVNTNAIDEYIERVCDMVESGVVDSYSVIKSILQDSVSLAGMLITTECLVVKDKNYERKNHLKLTIIYIALSLKHYQDKREFF